MQNRPGSLQRHSREVVLKVVAAQVGVGLLIAVGLFFFKGWQETYSALVGALIGALPSYYLGRRLFRTNDHLSFDEVLRQVYLAEIFKIGLTIALFLIAIVALDVDFRILIGVYAATVGVNLFAMRFADLGERPAQGTIKANDSGGLGRVPIANDRKP